MSGTLDSPSQVDTYTFAAAANDVVTLTVGNTSSGSFSPRADLRSPSTTLGTVGSGIKQAFTLPVAGTYTILVYDYGQNATGTYNIDLGGIRPTSANGVPIQLGDTKSGTIGVVGEVDDYVFTAAADDWVTLAVSNTYSGSYYPYADLYSPTRKTCTSSPRRSMPSR